MTVVELEKENAELKKQKEEIDIMMNFCKACKQIHTDQLTKAKELIERLLITPRTIYRKDEDGEPSSFFNPAYEEIKQQAEAFLKE